MILQESLFPPPRFTWQSHWGLFPPNNTYSRRLYSISQGNGFQIIPQWGRTKGQFVPVILTEAPLWVVHRPCACGGGIRRGKQPPQILFCSWRAWREVTSHLLGASGPYDLLPWAFWFSGEILLNPSMSTCVPSNCSVLHPSSPSSFKLWFKIHSLKLSCSLLTNITTPSSNSWAMQVLIFTLLA